MWWRGCPNVEECEDKVRGRSLHCDQHNVERDGDMFAEWEELSKEVFNRRHNNGYCHQPLISLPVKLKFCGLINT